VPEGFQAPPARQKPWGTAHAIWVAQAAIQEPFAAINSDDYYGAASFKVLGKFLRGLKRMDRPDYCMVGFILKNTLSEHGSVSRGICRISPAKTLREVVERTHIEKTGKKTHYLEGEKKTSLKGNEIVSMNMWGFTPALFGQLGDLFKQFLKNRGKEEKSEFLIPKVVDDLIRKKEAKVRVFSSKDQWFGVTYPADKEKVRENIQKLIDEKIYPENLWS
jgi:hypothetical protein